MYVSKCERFEEWKDAIRAYCEENGLSYDKACQMGKSWNRDMLALVCNDYTKLPDYDPTLDIPLPAVLWITRTRDGLHFEQTEYTQQFLTP